MNELERSALGMLLAGDHASLVVLRQQLVVAEVEAREFSGAGFFTKLRVPSSASRLEGDPRMVIGDVYAEVSGLAHPVGFLLFVSHGALDMLECFLHDEPWPAQPPTLVRAYYVHRGEGAQVVETPDRDLQWALR